MEEYVHRLAAGEFNAPFQPEFDNPTDPPGAQFTVAKPGIPLEFAKHPGESVYVCHRVGDVTKTERFFHYVNSQWVEVTPETSEEELHRLKAAERDFKWKHTSAAAATAAEPAAVTSSTAPAAAAAGAATAAAAPSIPSVRPVTTAHELAMDRYHLNVRMHTGPLTDIIRDNRVPLSNARTLQHVRSAFLNMVHLLRNATRNNAFPGELLFNHALDQSFLDVYHIMETNPAFLLGVIKGVSLMMPPEKLNGLSVVEHRAFKTGDVNNKERLFCASLMEHLKRANLHHTTMPVTTKVTDSTQRPVEATAVPPAPAAAAAAGSGAGAAATAAMAAPG